MTEAVRTPKEIAALKIVDLTKGLLLADNHFLSAAVGRLKVDTGVFSRAFATDGYYLGVDANTLCAQFLREEQPPRHDLLHTVMHCVFLHPYVGKGVERRLWDLACDIAVEHNVMQLAGPREGLRGQQQAAALEQLEQCISGVFSAEKIYRALAAPQLLPLLGAWEQLFVVDDHDLWYDFDGDVAEMSEDLNEASPAQTSDAEQGNEGGGQDGDGDGGGSADGAPEDEPGDAEGNDESTVDTTATMEEETAPAGRSEGSRSSDFPDQGQSGGVGASDQEVYSKRAGWGLRNVASADLAGQEEAWRRTAKALSVNLQTYAKARGKSLTTLVNELEAAVHERVDYASFLRQFAVPGEVLKLSDEEFDYNFYTYGLSLYGNLPLVEPLEYREEKRVREFAIVIDTSGSVYGDIVRRFVDVTFDILKSSEAFFEDVHVHIIQCDAAVQSDDVITSLDELKEWSRTMHLFGCSGTDFRPAFYYVDKLVAEGVIENLGGLIYFTDGWGDYPNWTPDYKAAFVFYDENYRADIVPPWAAQIVLDPDYVKQGT